MAPNVPIALSFIFTGLLIIAVCVPLLQGKIGRNALYGIRTPKAFESDELWFKINRYGAKQMMMWAAVMVALGIMMFFVPVKNAAHLATAFGVLVMLCVLIPTIQIFCYSKKL